MISRMPPPDDNAPIPQHVFLYQGVSGENGTIAKHVHPWGQISCIESGIASYTLDDNRLIGFHGLGVWLPPQIAHESYNYETLVFNVMNITPSLCTTLPTYPCMLRLTNIFQIILDDLFKRFIQVPETPTDLRLVNVLIDQLKISPVQSHFLPSVDDPFLSPILKHMEQNPAENIQLSQWAKKLYSTERTLARRFQTLLGMTFRECSSRVRFLHAVTLLENPTLSIEEIAFSLGYSSSSAFISMFRKFARITPEQYRVNRPKPSSSG